MAGPFDWLTGALGQTNPYDEARAWSNETQRRNRAAVGLDANGNPLPTDANGNPVTPAAVGDQAVKSAAMGQNLASGVMPSQQQPNATKTDPSLGAILMDMTQYQQREQGFNQAMGAGFAAVSQPRDREWVSHIFNVNEPDPTKLMQQEQDLASQQQSQDRMNSLGLMLQDPKQALPIANALNMPGDTPAAKIAALQAAYRADPQNMGRMITQTQQPTPQMANIEQINNYMGQLQQRDPSKSPEVLTMIKNAMLSGMGGPQAEAAIGDALAYKARTGKDAPWVVNGNIDQRAYKQFQTNEAQKESDRGDASKVLADNENTANELRTGLESIRDNPALEGMLNNPAKRALVQSIMKDPDATDVPSIIKKYALNNDEAQVIATLRRITGQSTANALHSLVGTGTRVTQQEVGPLKDSISTVLNFNQDYDNYLHNSLNPFITKIKKTVANSYGASGNLTHMDPELEPWLHPIYRKGGELFKEGGGAEAIPDLGPAPDTKIAQAKQIIADHPFMKDDLLDNLQQQGFDVGKYRHLDPTKW